MTTLQSLSFGVLLKRHRLAAGLTQEALAERAGLSARAVSDLERGVNRAPQRETLRLLADALCLPAPERAALSMTARRSTGASPLPVQPVPAGERRPIPLVGRGRERALLERHLAGEGPPILLFAGEPGIGKSRLLQVALEGAASYGLRALVGGCQRRGGQEPYAPLLNAIAGYIRRRSTAELQAELQECAWLIRLLPELATAPIATLPMGTLPPEQERRLLFAAVGRFLTNIAGPAGTLLVLDDLQWAGSDALDLLAALAHAADEVPVRMVAAYRDTEASPSTPLAALLADLAHAGLATHRTLAPLTREDVGALLAALLEGVVEAEPAARDRMAQRTGGVPFFVISCAHALQLGDGDDPGGKAAPWDVRQSIRQRMAALPEAARGVLGAAAVVGRVVRLDLLHLVVDQAEEVLLDALDAAGQVRLLVEDAQGYHFAHDIIREVVEAEVGAAQRRALHRRVAEALEQAPGEPAVDLLAYHFGRSDAPDRAMPYLEQAGDKARMQAAPAAAEGYYQYLVERLEGLGRPRDAARVREKLGRLLYTFSRYAAALAVFEPAVQTYQAIGDRDSQLRVLADIGFVHAVGGTVAEGLRLLEPMREVAGREAVSSGVAALHNALANLYHHSGQYASALAASARAVELARAVDDRWVLGRATWEQSNALVMLGRMDEAWPLMEDGLRLIEANGDALFELVALLSFAEAYLWRGQFNSGEPFVARSIALAERMGAPLMAAYALGLRGTLSFFAGRWDAAHADLAQAVRSFRHIDGRHMTAYVLSEQGWLSLAEGRVEEASSYLEEACRLASPSGDLQGLRWASYGLAERDLLAGDPAAARERLLPLLDRFDMEEHNVTALLPLLAWAELDLGHVGQAEEIAAQAVRRAHAQHNRLALTDALRVQGRVATQQGRWAEAQRSLDDGLHLARQMPYPYAEARLLEAAGLLHQHKEEPALARERLEAALRIVHVLGARGAIARLEQALAEGSPPTPGS